MKLTGRVVYRDVEGGVWVLEGDDGRTYQLAGGDRKLKRDGQRVELHGAVDSDVMTIHMVGPVFNVDSYHFI
jgi:cob(I)alamin adenosyltransferase